MLDSIVNKLVFHHIHSIFMLALSATFMAVNWEASTMVYRVPIYKSLPWKLSTKSDRSLYIAFGFVIVTALVFHLLVFISEFKKNLVNKSELNSLLSQNTASDALKRFETRRAARLEKEREEKGEGKASRGGGTNFGTAGNSEMAWAKSAGLGGVFKSSDKFMTQSNTYPVKNKVEESSVRSDK